MNGVDFVILLRVQFIVVTDLSNDEGFELRTFGENGGKFGIGALEDGGLLWEPGRDLERFYPVEIVAEECLELSSLYLKVEVADLCCELREDSAILLALQFVIGGSTGHAESWSG